MDKLVDMYAVYRCSPYIGVPHVAFSDGMQTVQSILICHKQPMCQLLQMLGVAVVTLPPQETSCTTRNTDYSAISLFDCSH